MARLQDRQRTGHEPAQVLRARLVAAERAQADRRELHQAFGRLRRRGAPPSAPHTHTHTHTTTTSSSPTRHMRTLSVPQAAGAVRATDGARTNAECGGAGNVR